MKFSIIMPTYNRAFIIERAIKSVINQEYDDWELIICDDGSKDNTKEIVGKYLTDNRIKYISYDKNKGVNYARNTAIEKATGNIIAFLDSDDSYFEYTLKVAYENISKYSEYDVWNFASVSKDGKKCCYFDKNIFTPSYQDVLCEKYKGDYFRFVKIEVFDYIKFDGDINAFECLTWFRIQKRFKSIYIDIELLLCWLDTESLVRDKQKITVNKEMNNRKAYERFIQYFKDDFLAMGKVGKKIIAQYYGRLGRSNINIGDFNEGINYTIQALKYNLFELRAWRNIFLFFIKKISIKK